LSSKKGAKTAKKPSHRRPPRPSPRLSAKRTSKTPASKKTPPPRRPKAGAPAPPPRKPERAPTLPEGETAGSPEPSSIGTDLTQHLLSLSFLRDGDEFTARLETRTGQITELKNRSLDQLLTLVAGELEDLLE
jgi:hypothetical protein